jgi:hypothetical protein
MYETLRLQVLNGGAQRTDLAALCYHGLLQGLQLLGSERSESQPTPAIRRTAPCNDALVRQLANMILSVQLEPMHVY